ncbi:MAG TPA: hypothetical protein VMX75_14005, partial [Spirochaetia bacterium]|nr:hypothetical protein [Spirochaetia bacterium]
MIDLARQQGTHAKFSGSGGAAVGVYESEEHFNRIREAYRGEGYDTIKAHPVEYSDSELDR